MRRISRFMNIVNFMLIIILIVSFVLVINMNVDTYTMYIKNNQLITYLNSNYIEKVVTLKEENKQTIIEDKNVEISRKELKVTADNKDVTNIQKKKNDNQKVETIQKKEDTEKEKEEPKKSENSKTEKVLEKLTGSLAGYGPDCIGCTSFRTASGRYIGEGKIYYEDKEYGKIRIVAGDKSYPFGTIIKISNTNYGDNSPIYAIVLDRGGGVGKGKKFLFDLLFVSEKEAAKAGSRKNVTFEILRLGY